MLKGAGMKEERLRLEWFSAGEGLKIARVMEDFTADIRRLGPNPLRKM